MRCLCCNKEVDNEKAINGWHLKCVKKFFNTSKMPNIDLDDFQSAMNDYILEKRGVTGVQEKLSLHLDKGDGKNSRLTFNNYPTGYIFKPDSIEYKHISIYEHITMLLADKLKIKTVPHALIKYNDSYAYITKRIDRDGLKRIHMEDFCQLSNKPTEYKYKGSYEKCLKLIDTYSTNKEIDRINFFEILIFSYVTLNSDMHLKNFSFIEDGENVYLSPFYDLLPVKLLVPNDLDDLALTINGKNRNLRKSDFIKFSKNNSFNVNACEKVISRIVNKENELIEIISTSLLDEEEKEKYILNLKNRINQLK
jgi:serine/threonine-protein kinase HipA